MLCASYAVHVCADLYIIKDSYSNECDGSGDACMHKSIRGTFLRERLTDSHYNAMQQTINKCGRRAGALVQLCANRCDAAELRTSLLPCRTR